MAVEALGRIGSSLIAPPQSLHLHVYCDAGGRATNVRVWGGIAVVGKAEQHWLQERIEELARAYPSAVSTDGEVKGGRLPLEAITATGRRLLTEDRRCLFWATPVVGVASDGCDAVHESFRKHLGSLAGNPFNLERAAIEAWFRRIESCVRDMPSINQHKVLSIIMHLQWLCTELGRSQLAQQLSRVSLVVDNENLADPGTCAVVIKAYLAAGLQSVGMSHKLTGSAFRENATTGAVTVEVDADSRSVPGLQAVDVLLQAVQRRLPSFGNPGTSNDAV